MTRSKHEGRRIVYRERYCAFLDILGFSEIVAGLDQAGSAEALRTLLSTMHAAPRGDNIRFFEGSDLRAQSISDALLLSAQPSPHGLAHLFHNLEGLAVALLEQGFFVRGAVVRGKLYHDERMAFGEGLVRAYRLEQDVVRYPRIMVTADIVKDVEAFLDQDMIDFLDVLKQAADGPHFLHILGIPELTLHTETYKPHRRAHIRTYNKMAREISRKFSDSADNPRHFEKVQWFANYWNEVMAPFGGEVALIKGPGLVLQ